MKTLKKGRFFKGLALTIVCVFVISLFSACGSQYDYDPLEGVETTTITDDCNRTVEIPAEITKIAASGSTAQMVLMAIAPDYLVGLSASPSTLQMPYFPEDMWYLPTFGQFYGSKSTLNMEALIEAEPQIIIDIGDLKTSEAADMSSIQEQTGIPTIYLSGDLEDLADTYRTLGQMFGKEEKAEELASYIEDTVAMAEENSAKIADEDRKTVYYGTGSSSLNCNASGSSQADVIDIVGGVNAVQVPDSEITNQGGGTSVNLEEIFSIEPDVLILENGGQYDDLTTNEWSALKAVENGEYYEVPNAPYSWMSSPPSVNRVLGIWWLGNILYPDVYDYDMVEKAQEYYKLFWDYDLSKSEAKEMLANSSLKVSAK